MDGRLDMSDKSRKEALETPKRTKGTKDTKKTKPLELSDHDLDQVSGGTGSIDKASPKLSEACSTGKHFDKVTL